MMPGLLLLALACAQAQGLEIWAVDPLEKVFRDARPPPPSAFRTRCSACAAAARGEFVSLQAVVRGEEALSALRAQISVFEGPEGATLPAARVRFVGYVPVRASTNIGRDRLRDAPAEFPDPLLEIETLDLPAAVAQPIWVTVEVPGDAPPGIYRALLDVSATARGEARDADLALAVTVHRVRVPAERHLWVTNWFSDGALLRHCAPGTERFSEDYWALLDRFARNLAAHRQNVVLTPTLDLVSFSLDEAGEMAFDFSMFDRWVETFAGAGAAERIEGGHIGGRSGPLQSPFVVRARTVRDGRLAEAHVAPDSDEARGFYSRFFPALVAHLGERGWLDRYLQHVADEPTPLNARSWRAAADLVRMYAPGVRTVDAIQATTPLAGLVDVWVPLTTSFRGEFHTARQELGDEVWIYTCVSPRGNAANRFIEQPLVKTRLLHWLNASLGATGYLHWGLNQWSVDDPFRDVEPRHGVPPYLPAGDAWIVYPSPGGILDSIRYETMRDGIEDHELLLSLRGRDAEAYRALLADPALPITAADCGSDLAAFRRIHGRLLAALSEGEGE